ncbi:MAG: pyrroline-5-carboxylate reductase [Bacteroidales bacterium]|nr:pyrroline-5-carboxylate reductase [Bacteroidales bacterium]
MKITVIGTGNIGSALIDGVLADGFIAPADITVTDIRPEALAPYRAKGLHTSMNNSEAVQEADIIFLCVKPYLVKNILSDIKDEFRLSQMLVVIAAGVTLQEIETTISGLIPVFRVIPNTAMAVNESITAVATLDTTVEQQKTVLDFFGHLGRAILIEESLMNAFTVVASCGTAYALRYLRASTTGSVQIGFKPDVAQEIVAQTMLGAAKLLLHNGTHAEAEIDKVCTPKGITIVGLNEMEHNGFSSAVMQGLLEAYRYLMA